MRTISCNNCLDASVFIHIKQTHFHTSLWKLIPYYYLSLLSSTITIMPNNSEKDTCECIGCCRYPNGPIPLILAQILLTMGALFSIESIRGCKFVEAKLEMFPVHLPDTLETYLPTESRRGLGFYFWELRNGKCSWDLDDDLTDELMEDYKDFLGGDWRVPRGMGTTALIFSWVIWIWIIVFCCLAHLRPVRYVVAALCLRPVRYVVTALCLLILVVFQGVTFAVVTSDLCDDADCKMGLGARYSIAAVFCFFFSGHLFLVTRNHPGDANAVTAVAAPVATGKGAGAGAHEEHDPTDMEEQTVEHVEDDQPTEQVVNEQVLNDGITDAQEVEAPSDLFVGSTNALIKYPWACHYVYR
jgi:hypothetical protein